MTKPIIKPVPVAARIITDLKTLKPREAKGCAQAIKRINKGK